MGKTRKYKPDFKKGKSSKKGRDIKKRLKTGEAEYSESFERFFNKKKK
tara:strand:+ start:30 stop:173 length:144 start_codon:yes stop_codon:yes gene_type:complete